ncbi:MAG: hypothetical protein NXI31_01555 [bacterium]|nr:hypothetical protein [bacterium]
MKTHHRCAWLATSLLAAGLAAQDFTRLREATSLRESGSGLHALAWDYQATFTAAGMRFVPALGEAAATTQHLAVELLDVRRGATAMPTADVGPSRGADGVRYDRGGGLTEYYAIGPAGIELSLRFRTRPAGAGDLVARFRVDTSLIPQPRQADEAGVTLLLPGVGGVTIGGVTGIDANGRIAPGSLQLRDGVLELRLSAAFVDEAAYPMVLDPLIGTTIVATTGTSTTDTNAGVAYSTGRDEYAVVYCRTISAVQQEIRANFVGGLSGPGISGPFLIAAAAAVAQPTVVSVPQQDALVVGWLQANSLFAPYELLSRSLASSNGAVGVTTVIGNRVEKFDMAADNGPAGNRVLYFYDTPASGGPGTEIRLDGFSLPSGGGAPVFNSRTVLDSTTWTFGDLAISRSQQSNGACITCWSESIGSLQFLNAQACDLAGSPIGSSNVIESSTGEFGTVAVDGDGTEFLVAYGHAANGERDIEGIPLMLVGTTLIEGSTVQLAGGVNTEQVQPALAWCRYKYVFVWADQVLANTFNYDVRGVELDRNGTPCGATFRLLGLNSTIYRAVEFQPAIASQMSGGLQLVAGDGDEALIVFTEADDAPPFSSDVIGHRVRALGGGGTIAYAGTSCGNPGVIGTSGGPAAVGNTDFRVTLANAPVNAVPFLTIGFPGGETVCGACSLNNQVAALFIFPQNGGAEFQQPLPCSIGPFVGTTLQFQWTLLNSGASPCPLFPGIGASATRRLQITIGS